MLKRLGVGVFCIAMIGCGSDNSPTTPSSTTSQTRIIGVIGNLTFGNVSVGSSATASLTITNSGTGPLAVTGMTITGGLSSVFTSSFTSGTIAAGGSQQVTIGFAPTAAQTYSGTINVVGNQTSGTNSIAVSGTGTLVRANIQLASSTGSYFCLTGLCTLFTYPIANQGPGCATNVSVITRFYGGDGNGPQLGIDVPMGLASGGSLGAMLFRVGTTVTLQNLVPFNDIRSAHTVFRPTMTWIDAPCQ
jgi:Abnormal spindle-like microcephaly-assoc'd, ASPM-SPD-2-Hydin